MSDRMRIIPFDKLILWALEESEREKSIFGVPNHKFYRKSGCKHLSLFGNKLENPLGPAAGPNTQLAQNIIAAYVAGSRFFELKTVQKIDGEDLPVSKPCILVKDEGYNVEWSTELTVPDALNEYIKAWFALNILSKEFSLGSKDGFIFNMSVGYDLEGIKSPKINTFIENLMEASHTPIWKECKDFLLNNLRVFKKVNKEYIERISSVICKSITLSTLHGCPPEEIERIATYLLEDKKLHTYIKCNPTLLGYEFARKTIDQMGYDYLVFDDHHFKNDLQFEDAIAMIARLKTLAKDLNLTFGVKLTNTFPVKIVNNELPGEEMYMSGRALYPLTINLAYRLAKVFGGDIRISYSGGADFFNIKQIYETGIWPITLATTILKPGGYLRFKQMSNLLEVKIVPFDFQMQCYPKLDNMSQDYIGIDLNKLKVLADESVSDIKHAKNNHMGNRKIENKVPLTDCIIAPCKNGCPIKQDIPEYIRLVGEERYQEALEVIIEKNPLPFITGTLCNHRCMTKCTRLDYEESVRIREMKLVAAMKGYPGLISRLETPKMNSDFKVAVIGGGPAGLAGAYFLAKNGVDVTVFEKKQEIGGIIQHIAPEFRISKEAINNDIELIRKMGVKFRVGVDARFSVEDLKRNGYKYIFIAIGAWKSNLLKLETCDKRIINVLEFLEAYNKNSESLKLGKNVAVIGAGNSAMDAARAAKRVPGVDNVIVVYRRTRKYMPADEEELGLALQEGVTFRELLAPISFVNGILRCQKMELSASDTSGRKKPIAACGEFTELSVDSIIAAVGEQVETELLIENNIQIDLNRIIKVNPTTNETSVENVFVGGDALKGPSTIVEGIADGTKVAKIILEREKGQHVQIADNRMEKVATNPEKQMEEILAKKGVLQLSCDSLDENQRCLECHKICNLCTEVCPNRANIAVSVSSEHLKCRDQIIHIDGMCNECGNCMTFCPYDSAPYKDKFTLYWNKEDFEDSNNNGFIVLDKSLGLVRVRLNQKVVDVNFDLDGNCSGAIPIELAEIIWTLHTNYPYVFVEND